MNELTEEEVLHIAHLARIEISHDEMESYKKELNEIMNQINRVNEVNIDTCDYIFSPTENKNEYIPDVGLEESIDIKVNAPKTSGNYIEVRRVIND
ncbi:aspartyl/glutamyl-tRNA(Asn/Gln) amidotransferase subunit C [Clostridium sp. CAG:1193]|jgi:aspartyl-tRNA(Asn)/glutamyl-tRNA(Gln) amidotransferase subunit C|nr:aspartyl/glutamyl-tRNA(Asn/Gln) amidotransferase subunit C [Clostridium sp. CAG:1193]